MKKRTLLSFILLTAIILAGNTSWGNTHIVPTSSAEGMFLKSYLLPLLAVLAGAFPLPLIKNTWTASFTITAFATLAGVGAVMLDTMFIAWAHAFGLILGIGYKIKQTRDKNKATASY